MIVAPAMSAIDVLGPDLARVAGRSDTAIAQRWRGDVVRAALRLNGVTIGVVAADHDAAEIKQALPPGIDMIVTGETGDEAVVTALTMMLDRGFERLTAVVAGCLPLPVRLNSTVLSTTTRADIVVGPTAGGKVYAVGIRDLMGLNALVDGALRDAATVLRAGANAGLSVACAEQWSLLSEATSMDGVRQMVNRTGVAAPALRRWIRDRERIDNLATGDA